MPKFQAEIWMDSVLLTSANKFTNYIELREGIYIDRGFIPVKIAMRWECSRYTSDVLAIVTKQQIV